MIQTVDAETGQVKAVIHLCSGSKRSNHVLLRALSAIFIIILCNACTVKHSPIPTGTIPKTYSLAPGEAEFGEELFKDLCTDYKLESNKESYGQLVKVFLRLIHVAEADHLPWHIYLFDDPNVVDVRAVHGNYVFVWSGFLDVVESEHEMAAILAWEISHVLAGHTVPVEFTLWSDVFFDVAELATSLAVMQLSHGAVVISGRGWMKWGYVELADYDPLDRKYNEADEREAATIALFIIDRTPYSPEAMLTFWQRVQKDDMLRKKVKRLNRDLSPHARAEMLQGLLQELPLKPKPILLTNDKISQLDISSSSQDIDDGNP
jgi:predicted Zn-dependent protease